jgi:predicted small lipoprotein YifL
MAPVLRRLAIPSRPAASPRRPAASPRRLAAIPVLLASGVALAACGGHGPLNTSPSSSATTSTKAARPGKTARPASPPAARQPAHVSRAVARARAFVRAVNLQASDVPGFAVSGEHHQHHEGAAEKRLERELHACAGGLGVSPGAKEHTAIAEASSPTYERKAGIASQSVSSTVTVEASAAAAAKLLTALHSRTLQTCLSHAFAGLLRAQHISGASIGPVSVKYGSPPAPGTGGGYALRVRTTIVVHQIPIPFYLDILGFVDGQAEVSMLAITVPQPLTATLEEHLYELLLERTRSHAI